MLKDEIGKIQHLIKKIVNLSQPYKFVMKVMHIIGPLKRTTQVRTIEPVFFISFLIQMSEQPDIRLFLLFSFEI
jgi:hypothetical protein